MGSADVNFVLETRLLCKII